MTSQEIKEKFFEYADKLGYLKEDLATAKTANRKRGIQHAILRLEKKQAMLQRLFDKQRVAC